MCALICNPTKERPEFFNRLGNSLALSELTKFTRQGRDRIVYQSNFHSKTLAETNISKHISSNPRSQSACLSVWLDRCETNKLVLQVGEKKFNKFLHNLRKLPATTLDNARQPWPEEKQQQQQRVAQNQSAAGRGEERRGR